MFKHFTKSQSTLFASLSLSISLCWFSPTYTRFALCAIDAFSHLLHIVCASLDMPIVEINRLFFFAQYKHAHTYQYRSNSRISQVVSRLAVRRKKQTKCNFLSKPFRYVHSNYISLMVMVVAATYSSACNEPLNYFIGLIFLSFFHFLFVNAPLKSIANDFVYSGHFMIMIMLFFQYNYPVVSFTFIYFASLNTSVYRHLYNTENMCNTKCLITFFLHSLQSQIK